MSRARRVGAVALTRIREGVRGPVLLFLLIFLGLAIAATLITPGEPGTERQRAVDGLVLQIARLVLVLAAAALATASLSGDRDAGREPLLRATPLGPVELLVGGFLGHAACLLVLLAGMYFGSISVTGFFAGGDTDRIATRVRLQDTALFTADGRRVENQWARLTKRHPTAYYEFDVERDKLPFDEAGGAQAWILLLEILAGRDRGFPDQYPVGVRIGGREEQILQIRRENPVKFTLRPDDIPASGPLRIHVRRVHPAFNLGLRPGGLVVQGRTRPFSVNLLKALIAWFLALLPVCAAATALSTLTGAPVAAAGTLFFVVLATSHGFFREAAGYAASGQLPAPAAGRWIIEHLPALLPDLSAYDLSVSLTERWDIATELLFGRMIPSLSASAVLLALAYLFLFIRRRM